VQTKETTVFKLTLAFFEGQAHQIYYKTQVLISSVILIRHWMKSQKRNKCLLKNCFSFFSLSLISLTIKNSTWLLKKIHSKVNLKAKEKFIGQHS